MWRLPARTMPDKYASRSTARAGARNRLFRPLCEALEGRCLLAVGPFVEDFTDDVNPSVPGFDTAADGLQFVHNSFGTLAVLNRTPHPHALLMEVHGESDDQVIDQITFSGVHAAEPINLVTLDLIQTSLPNIVPGEVLFFGNSGPAGQRFASVPVTANAIGALPRITMASSHVLADGQPLGPITKVVILAIRPFFIDTMTVGVGPANTGSPPVAVDDPGATTTAGQSVEIAVLSNDNDPDGDPLAIASFSGAANGAVVRSGDSLRYTPISGFGGTQPQTDTFTYTITDGRGNTSLPATVTVLVSPPLPPGRIHGVVYEDVNGNGVRDGGELGLSGASIFLDLDNDRQLDFDVVGGQLVAAEPVDETDTLGYYEFNLVNVPAGSMGVGILTSPPGGPFSLTAPPAGFWQVAYVPGQTFADRDFGLLRQPSIRGTIWDDLNGDTLRDPGEPGLANWIVYADENENGQQDLLEFTAVTDASGQYVLNVTAGTYVMRQALQGGWQQSFPGSAGHAPITLALGEERSSVDFGNQLSPGEIRGVVWHDVNGNGIRDDVGNDGFFDEPGQFGLTVYLDLNENRQRDPEEPSRVTAQGGNYAFAGLTAGRTYVVAEELPAGFAQTAPGFPAQRVHRVSLAPAQTILADFGNTGESLISGTRFFDANGDGQPTVFEQRLAGHTIFLDLNRNSLRDAGEPSAVTDVRGDYLFRGLPPGVYTVVDEADRATLTSPIAATGRDFGFSVAAGGSSIVVGDPRALRVEPTFGSLAERGRVFVYGRSDYQLKSELIDQAASGSLPLPFATPTFTDAFGFSVAVNADRIAVGAPNKIVSTVSPQFDLEIQGVVFEFHKGGSLIAADSRPGRLGTSLAYVRDAFLVSGSPDASAAQPDSPGFIKVTSIDLFSPQPSHHQSLGIDHSDFGESLAVAGNRLLLVGDPASEFVALDSGLVYLSELPLGNVPATSFGGGLGHPTAQPHANFGVSIAGLGTNALVGAPGDDTGGTGAGAAYLFDLALDSDPNNLLRTFLNPTPSAGDHFGFSVAVVGGNILIGAPGDDTLGDNAGAAYLFDPATGELLNTFFSPNPLAGALFGFSLAAVDESRIIVGAPSPGNTPDPGTAYILAVSPRVSITSPGQSPIQHFPQTADDDADGVPNGLEVLPNGDADGNNDHVPDSQQSQVVTLPAAGGKYVTFTAFDGASFEDFRLVSPLPPGAPAADFPLGLFEFTLQGVVAGEVAHVLLVDHSSHELNSYFKHDAAAGWDEFEWNEETGAQFEGNLVRLRLRDGGRGDADGLADGRIVDPGGPAFISPPVQVDSVVVNDGAIQRSMVSSLTVAFSNLVTIEPGAFELRRLGQSQPIQLLVALSESNGRTMARLTFTGQGIVGGSLADGTYRLTIRGDKVRDALGRALDGDGDGAQGGDSLDEFFRRFGDTDGDDDVDLVDAELFGTTFGKRSRDSGYLWFLDANANGRVWAEDLALFLLGYLRSALR